MFYFGSNTKRDLSELIHQEITDAAIDLAKTFPYVKFFLLPSIPYFQNLKARSEGSTLWIGNQNVSSTSGEDVTGEVSAKTLKSLNSDLVMVGHAERRRRFDGAVEIASQLAAVAKENLRTLFCIGETVKASDFIALSELLRQQLEPLSRISVDVLVAYEPVFSIGVNGIQADPAYVEGIKSD